MKLRVLSLLLASALMSGACASAPIVDASAQLQNQQTGVYVTATHQPLQWILWFHDGATLSVDETVAGITPWGQARFFEVAPGKHKFRLFFAYLGQSGVIEGCLNLQRGQVIQLGYTTPHIVTSAGNVTIRDLKTNETVTRVAPPCN